MLSRHDLIDISGLSEAVITAIAVHEHVSEPVAAAFGSHLLDLEDGTTQIRNMITANIRRARRLRYGCAVREFEQALRSFDREHVTLH